MLRLIGGRWRGRKLLAPDPALAIRPTAERIRVALFDKLAHADFGDGRGAALRGRILDACCGSGALGIEALSRGATAVTFLDSLPAACSLVRRNLTRLAGDIRAAVIQADATCPPPSPAAHDLLLLDPPYAGDVAHRALVALSADGWLVPGAVAAVEVPAKPIPPTHGGGTTFALPERWELIDDRRYGAGRLLFLRFVDTGATVENQRGLRANGNRLP